MIETRDLTKKYDELFAVKSLSIRLQPGDVFGFIGPNGAGKTTTMRMLATLLNPTWGEAYVCGHSIYTHPKEIRHLIGFMPDFFGVYDDMKVIEYLEFFAAAYRIKGPKRRKVCEDVLELVGLTYKRDALATSLSRGMNQRLGLARVLLHDPQVLLLDEPASGLDPRVRIEIRELIRQLGRMGKTIMVSSHILPELADMCNKVGIIERGELLQNEDVAELIKRVRAQTLLRISVTKDLDAAARVIEQHPCVDRIEIKDGVILATLVEGVTDYSELPSALINSGHRLTMFKEDELNLRSRVHGPDQGHHVLICVPCELGKSMGQKLVVIATYPTPEEASISQQSLKANGIEAFLDQVSVVGNFWYLGNATGGVKLEVLENDATKARAILAEILRPDPTRTAWNCTQCGSQCDAEFDVCWSCGASRDGEPDPNFYPAGNEVPQDDLPGGSSDASALDLASPVSDIPIPRQSSNPYVSPSVTDSHDELPQEALETDAGDIIAVRAFRAAVVGVALCPPLLNLYSMYLLIGMSIKQTPLGTKGNRCFFWACVFNLVSVLTAVFFGRLIIF